MFFTQISTGVIEQDLWDRTIRFIFLLVVWLVKSNS